jgi:hypothetical protein
MKVKTLVFFMILALNNMFALGISAADYDVLREEDEFIYKEGVTPKVEVAPKPALSQPTKEFLEMAKREHEAAKKARAEMYDPNLIAELMTPEDDGEDEVLASYQEPIAKCYDDRKDEIELGEYMLSQNLNVNDVAALTEAFTAVNDCYESLGVEIINTYYPEDADAFGKLAGKSEDFYVNASDTSFRAEYCADFCSVGALVAAQKDKFAEYRVYLNKLIADRPKKEEAPCND